MMTLNSGQVISDKIPDKDYPSDVSNAKTDFKLDGLASIRHMLGAADFRRMMYNVVIGNQLVIRCYDKNIIQKLINTVKVLLLHVCPWQFNKSQFINLVALSLTSLIRI